MRNLAINKIFILFTCVMLMHCSPKEVIPEGCTCQASINFDENAVIDDGTCLGCTQLGADNYNKCAEIDDGNCFTTVVGCTDPKSFNYNINANTDDGSCIYLANVTTGASSNLRSYSATVNGNVTDNGKSTVTARGIVWNNAPNPVISLSTKINAGSGNGTFSASLINLTAGTKYYARAFATNAAGTVYGNEITFTTPPSFKIVNITPTNDSEKVELNQKITLTFSNNVSVSSVNSNNITLRSSMDGYLNLSMSVSGKVVTITPNQPLREFIDHYEFVISANVYDEFSNNLETTGAVLRFSTVALSSEYYYRFINYSLGSNYSLNTLGGTYTCTMSVTGDYTGEYWSAISTYHGYLLYNAYRGSGLLMTDIPNDGPAWMAERHSEGEPYGNQYWQFARLGSSSFDMMIWNSYYGSEYLLDENGGNVEVKTKATTSSGRLKQYWKIIRLHHI